MDDILSLLQDFDVANFLPAPDQYLIGLEWWTRLAVLVGPLLMLGLGLWYRYRPPKEANHRAGFRTYWAMGSVEAWQFAQRLAGISYTLVGGGLSALMLVVSLFFSGKRAGAMAVTALICVIIELLVIFAVWLGINILVYKAYDKDGKRRPEAVDVFKKGAFSKKK